MSVHLCIHLSHYDLELFEIRKLVLGYSLARLYYSLVHLLHIARFAQALRCTYLLGHVFIHSRACGVVEYFCPNFILL